MARLTYQILEDGRAIRCLAAAGSRIARTTSPALLRSRRANPRRTSRVRDSASLQRRACSPPAVALRPRVAAHRRQAAKSEVRVLRSRFWRIRYSRSSGRQTRRGSRRPIRFARLEREGLIKALFTPARSPPHSVALRPCVAARSSMKGRLVAGEGAAERGREKLIQFPTARSSRCSLGTSVRPLPFATTNS